MSVAILGYGIVGKATHLGVLDSSADVILIDVKNCQKLYSHKLNLVFICLPSDNAQDLDRIEDYCRDLIKNNAGIKICIRSSVPIGFFDSRLSDISQHLLYFPEFLRERQWAKDARRNVWIVGCDDDNQTVLLDYAKTKMVIFVSFGEAEILKMMSNAHSAMQIVFANHMFDISDKIGARYQVIERCHDIMRHRDQSYLEASEDLRGFGGKCLPKDLDHLIRSFEALGLEQTLLDSIRADNKKWPVTVRQDP